MEILSENSYRRILKLRIKELQKTKPNLTWRKLAAEIPMQYTYLSKALNDGKTHLSEDSLFVICRALQFSQDEVEFIFLLRSEMISQDPERKSFLQKKIRQLKNSKDLAVENQILSSNQFNDQVRYLFEPLCLVVHQALEIDYFRKDPTRLCAPLTLTLAQLKEILRTLSRNDYIELDETNYTVKKIKGGNIHFGPEHFLMRYHLSMVKSQIIARLARTPDQDRFSFLVTFTLDEPSYQEAREEFKKYLKKVEKIAGASKSNHVYQLSFDLFKWV